MRRILKKYYQAWILKEKGLTLKEIGMEMELSGEWVRTMIGFIKFKIENKNTRRISNELKTLIKKIKG